MAERRKIRNITDLAHLAGVSPATVSRALSGKGIISGRTRDLVRALAEEHDFQPNALARNLRTKKTGAIGVVIPLGHARNQHISDPFFMTLIGCLADGLTEHGYDLVLSRVIPENANWLDKIIDSGRTDGLIVIGQSDQMSILDAAALRHKPLIVWGGYAAGQTHCSVGSDNFLGGMIAGQHLIERGARRIAFVGDPRASEVAQRLDGLKAALEEAGLSDELRVQPTPTGRRRDDVEIFDFLTAAPRADGIFAASDVLAMTTLQALAELGVSVPDETRVIGYDDLPLAEQTVPRLTTIRQDIALGAEYLIDTLLRRIAGEDTAPVVLRPQLCIRRSS